MTPASRLLVACALAACVARPAQAADVPAPIRNAAICGPLAAAAPPAADVARVVGSQDTVPRSLFSARDLLVIDSGTARGLQLGQTFFIRRMPAQLHRSGQGPRGITTAGRLRIVAVNETTAIAAVEFACGAIFAGDYLEPYVETPLPPDVHRVVTVGEPDFSAPAVVLFGENDRVTGAPGDFIVADVGQARGTGPGARLAIYRDPGVAGVPLAAIGDAVVVSAHGETVVIRVTRARDAVTRGDLLFPRRMP